MNYTPRQTDRERIVKRYSLQGHVVVSETKAKGGEALRYSVTQGGPPPAGGGSPAGIVLSSSVTHRSQRRRSVVDDGDTADASPPPTRLSAHDDDTVDRCSDENRPAALLKLGLRSDCA